MCIVHWPLLHDTMPKATAVVSLAMRRRLYYYYYYYYYLGIHVNYRLDLLSNQRFISHNLCFSRGNFGDAAKF